MPRVANEAVCLFTLVARRQVYFAPNTWCGARGGMSGDEDVLDVECWEEELE